MAQTVDFLGIGVQKAASSWLHENLRNHPEIWVPPRKELHYFDRLPEYPTPSYLASKNLIYRLFGQEQHNKQFRDVFQLSEYLFQVWSMISGISVLDFNHPWFWVLCCCLIFSVYVE